MKKILTLCLVHQHPRVLLGMKKRGFGAGKWNGFGGKVEAGETIEAAARRELKEEAGIHAENLEHVGILDFSWEGKLEAMEVHVFKTSTFKGDPIEGEEMRPEWFHTNDIPFHSMWPDDIHWMPLALAGKKFRGKFVFNDANEILEPYLEEVSMFS